MALRKWLVALSLSFVTTAHAQGLMVYVAPNALGVNAFLKMGKTGVEAAARKHRMKSKVYEAKTATERLEFVNAAINEGAQIITVIGREFGDIMAQAAPSAPDVQFLMVDTCISPRPANVSCAQFREYEAAYLIGVTAGSLTKSNKVGVVGAIDIPFLHRYTDAYVEGVKSVKPQAQVQVRWVGGEHPFSDPVRSKEQALALAAAGTDYVFTVTSGGDYGVFEAAKEKNFKTFAVDVNHCPEAPGLIVDQTLKRVDVAINTLVDAILAGKKGTSLSLGLKEGGMSVVALETASLASSQCLIAHHAEVVNAVRKVAAAIVSGTLKLEDPMLKQR